MKRDNPKPLKTHRLSVPLSEKSLSIIEHLAKEEKRSVAKQLEFIIEYYIKDVLNLGDRVRQSLFDKGDGE